MEYLYIRLHFYNLLRRIFIHEPDVALLNFLKETNASDLVEDHFEDAPAIEKWLHLSLTSLLDKNISRDSDEFHDLHWDFTRLFIGPDTLLAAPWESSYKNNRLLFTETTLQVKACYQQHGFCLPESEIEAADHIGFEFDFIYHLSHKLLSQNSQSLPQLKDNLRYQLFFLETHILSFIELLMGCIAKHALTDFYRNIALFTAAFIKRDVLKIKSLLSEM